jgi:hypothetical protein
VTEHLHLDLGAEDFDVARERMLAEQERVRIAALAQAPPCRCPRPMLDVDRSKCFRCGRDLP